jgi:F420-dependent oxidoreductase-like protein
VRFGLDVSQHQLEWADILERVRLAEEAGFDGAWVFDHFQPLYGDSDGPCLEGWTLLSALAACTVEIRLGTLVTGMTYRHPAILAAQAVTVDHISGGRLELAVGAAWFEEEHEELGIPFPDIDERAERLEEGVQVLRALLTKDDVTFEGAHYQLWDASYHPRPVQAPHPPIWIGAAGERLMLPIVGRQADVWHTWGTVEEFKHKARIVDAAAEQAGRDPSSIARSVGLSISEPWDAVRSLMEGLIEAGVTYFTVDWPSEGRARLDEFVEHVMPRYLSV